MTKSFSAEISNLIKSAKGESLPYRQIFDAIEKAIPATQVLMTSTLPRGGTQIVQPSNCPEIIIKGYNRDLHVEDRLTWRAILSSKPVRGGKLAFTHSVSDTSGSSALATMPTARGGTYWYGWRLTRGSFGTNPADAQSIRASPFSSERPHDLPSFLPFF